MANMACLTKQGSQTPIIQAVKGDRNTKNFTFVVERYDGEVDLSELVWMIETVNAAGVTDGTALFTYRTDKEIQLVWPVGGLGTAEEGRTQLQVIGFDTQMNKQWSSGLYYMDVGRQNLPDAEQLEPVSQLKELIEQTVKEGGKAADGADNAASEARAAAASANDAAGTANAAANRANAAADTANTAAEGANRAASTVSSASAAANSAARAAEEAAQSIYEAINEAETAAEEARTVSESTNAAMGAANAAAANADSAAARALSAASSAEKIANITAEATTLAAGSAATAEYKNGKLTLGIPKGADGQKGDPGYTPVKGKDYFDGKDGYTPVKGKDYFDGAKGDPGYTPVKGKDYYTEAEKAEFVEEVLDAMPEGGGGGGGSLPTGGEPHQQMVTDANGKAGWEDKLAYSETLKAEVLPETELIWIEDAGAFALVDQPETMPVVGIKHKVAYNGTTYECEGVPFDDGSMQGVFLGNEGLFSGDIDPTGPLFGLIFVSEEAAAEQGMWGLLFPLDGATSAAVSVEINGENVKQIDRKFVPDSRFLVSVTEDAGVYYVDCTYEQLLDAYNAGQTLVCRYNDDNSTVLLWTYYAHHSGPEGRTDGDFCFVHNENGDTIDLIYIGINLEGNTVVRKETDSYSLPIADKNQLGGVRVGAGLKSNEDTGELSVDEDFIHTPVKGQDYWTPADQESIVQQVIATLGTPVFGRVEADKNIILTANNLAAGTYKLWIEDEDGAHSKLCDYTHGGAGPSYTNVIPLSTDVNGNPYNGGLGYREGYRYSNSGGGDVVGSGLYTTGYIKCNGTDTLYFKNVGMNKDAGVANGCHMYLFTALDAASTNTIESAVMTQYHSAQWDANGNIVSLKVTSSNTNSDYWVRFNTTYLGPDSIITINEPITDDDSSPTYTNLFAPGTATINTRMSASSSAAKAQDGYVMTARIYVPSFTASGTLGDDAPYLAVPAGMWTESANIFMGSGESFGVAYVGVDGTAGTTENRWTKIPLYNQWGGDKTIEYLTVSLYVNNSALTTADIQNIQIYFNECPA